MSEKNEVMWALLDSLLQMKGYKGVVKDPEPKAQPQAEKQEAHRDDAPLSAQMEEIFAEDAEPVDLGSKPGPEIPKAPREAFNWQDEAKIAYIPGRISPVGEARNVAPTSPYSWPEGRRRKQHIGDGPVYSMPSYRYKGGNYEWHKDPEQAEDHSVPDDRHADSQSTNSGRAPRSPYGYYKPNQRRAWR